MRFFNRGGPVNAADHYVIPPLDRVDLTTIDRLIDEKMYFVMHAPRQTGKTTVLLALMHHLNETGRYRCVYVNVEPAQAMRENVRAAMQVVLSELAQRAELHTGDMYLARHWRDLFDAASLGTELGTVLSKWAAQSTLPLVVLFDEIDTLVGDSLVSFLRQIRSRYDTRPTAFLSSVVLCGVRDVRDYRLRINGNKEAVAGGSAFNIKVESLRLGDFSRAEVEALLAQHSDQTGQVFDTDAIETIWANTLGQPWLVNALAYEVCSKMPEGLDRSHPIDTTMIERAKENIIQRRETHLHQLADKLSEDRVRRVVERIISGEGSIEAFPDDDIDYVCDLGLVRRDGAGEIQIANPIYREVIPRQLVYSTQGMISEDSTWYRRDDGSLDIAALLEAFQVFFRENIEHWGQSFDYREAGPQLLLQAYLQRVVNGGGLVEREYGLGRGRTDIFVRWPLGGGFAPGRPVQRVVIELKLVHDRQTLDKVIADGLQQTAAYVERCGADEAHLVVFDRRQGLSWDEKIFRRPGSITVWGM